MKKVAIVGAGGFVGARFVEMALLDRDLFTGWEVVPVIRQPRGLGRLSKFGLTNHRVADAAKPETLVSAFVGCDAVVNLTMGDNTRTLPDVQNLHTGCVAAKVPLLIHMSSAEVFGRCATPGLNDESPWFSSHWMEYAREKGKAEDWLRALPQVPTSVVTLRPGLVWGPRSPWVAGPAQMIFNGSAVLIDDGRWSCNLCHVDNLIYDILAVIQSANATPGLYNVGDPGRPDWRTYFTGLAAEMGFSDAHFHLLKESDFKESILNKIFTMKDVSAAKAIKRRMRSQTKEKIKFWLLKMRRKLNPPDGVIRRGPNLTKGIWWLQTTRYHLPVTKFQSVFQPANQLTFAQGVAQTGEWLRFSGFSRTEQAVE